MRFAKQLNVIRVTANRLLEDDRDACRANRHGPLLPNSVRGVICGPSGCGKTNVLLSMLESPNGLRFENVYVYSKSLHQPKYRYLEQVLSLVDGIEYFPYSDNTEIVPPRNARPDSIFVFDDVACDEQNTIREYFSMGRHSNVDCFYLCQSYARIPKHLIRDNANFLMLFKQDGTNLRRVYNDHVNTHMTFESFNDLCARCWRRRYDLVVIDKDSSMYEGRYRRGFNEFVVARGH